MKAKLRLSLAALTWKNALSLENYGQTSITPVDDLLQLDGSTEKSEKMADYLLATGLNSVSTYRKPSLSAGQVTPSQMKSTIKLTPATQFAALVNRVSQRKTLCPPFSTGSTNLLAALKRRLRKLRLLTSKNASFSTSRGNKSARIKC